MIHIHRAEYPHIHKALALIWEDNIPELAVPTDIIIKEPNEGWYLKEINRVLGTLTDDELEIFAFGELDDRLALVQAKPELGQANDLAETYFEELC
jgi:hypothetical protein